MTTIHNIPRPLYLTQRWVTQEFNHKAFLWPYIELRPGYGLDTAECTYDILGVRRIVKVQVAPELNKPIQFILN